MKCRNMHVHSRRFQPKVRLGTVAPWQPTRAPAPKIGCGLPADIGKLAGIRSLLTAQQTTHQLSNTSVNVDITYVVLHGCAFNI